MARVLRCVRERDVDTKTWGGGGGGAVFEHSARPKKKKFTVNT